RDAHRESLFLRLHAAFERFFERLRSVYCDLLADALAHRRLIFIIFAGSVGAASGLALFVGRDFFPAVDAGQVRLHITASPGTRLEETEGIFGRVEERLRSLVPVQDRESILDQFGMPGGYNLAITDCAN